MGTPAASARDPPRQTAERDLKSKVSRPDVQEAGIDSPPGRSAFRDFQRSAGLTHADNAMKSVGHVNKLSCHNNVSVAVCETPLGMETCRTNQEALDIGLTLDCENIVPSPDSMEILDNDEVSQSSDHVVVLSLDKDNVIHSSDSNEVLTDNNNKVTDAPDNFNVFPDSALVSHFSSAEFLHVNSSNDDENPDYDKVPANSCSNDKVPANATDSGKVPANATGDYKVPANASVVDELLSNASDHEVLSHELDSDESLDHDEILDHDDILDIPVSDLSYSPCNEDALLVDSGDTLVHIHAKNDAFPHHLAVDEGFPHALANNDALQDAPANNYAPESDDALPCAAAKNETPGSDFVIPHASANDDARPHASESYDAFPHATESYDALPHATESYDAPESDDARPHAPESDDARPHASESYDALPHATEIDDALTHAPESYYTLPNASDVPENQDILAEKFTQCSDNINVHSDVSIHVPDNDHMLIDDTEQFTQCSDNINVQSDVSVYGSETYENVHHVPCSGYVQYAESLETALDTQTPMDQTHSCETDDNVDSLNLSVCSDDNFIPVGVCDVRCQTAQLQDISVQNNDTSSYLQLCTPNERKSEQTVSDKHELHNERSSSLSDIEDIIEPDAVLEDNSVNENRSQSESYVAAENFALTLTMPADGQSLDMDTYVDQIEVAVETVITTDSELIEDVPYLPAQESPNSMTGSSTQESSNSVTDLPTNDSSNAVTNLPTQESSNSVTSLPTQESSNAVTSLKTQESSNAVTNLPTQESSNAVTNLPTQESSNSVTNLPTQGNSNSVTGPPSPMPCPSPAKRSPDYIPNVHTSKTDAQHLEIKTTLGISMLKNSHKSSQTRSAGSSTLKNSPKSSLSKSDTDHFKQEQKLLSPTVNSLKLKFKMLGHTTICSMSDQPAESKTEPIASEDSDSNSSSVSTTSSSSDESGSEDETGTKPPAEKQIPKWLDELIDSTGDSDSDIASNSCSNPPSVSSGSESHSVECPLQADTQMEVPGDMKTAQTDAPICVPQMVRKIPVVQESQSSASDSKLRRSNSSNMVLSCVPARSAAVKALSKMKPLLSEEQAVDVDSDYCGKFKKIVQKSKTLYPKTKTAVNTSHEMTDHQKPSALERSNGAGKSAASVKRSAAVYMCGYCLGISEGSLKKIKPHVLTKHSSMPPMVINCFKQRMHRQCNFYICPQLTCSRLFSREKDFEMHRRSHSEESSSQKSQGGTRRDSLTSRGLPFSGGLSGAPTVRTSTRTSVAHFPSLRVELDMLDVRKLKTTVRQEEKKYLCLYCTDYFYDSSLTGMKSHYSKDHAGQLMVMRDTEARKAQLPSRIYVCEMPNCECHYISRPDLDHHSKGHKSNSTYIYECACCGWYSSSHLGAVQHVRSQHGDESNVSLIHMQVSVDEYGQTSKKVL